MANNNLLGLFSKFVDLADIKDLKSLLDSDNDALKKLTDDLIKEWKKAKDSSGNKIWQARKADEKDVESGLRTMISRGFIDAAKLSAAFGSGNPVAIAKEGIEFFQLLANSGNNDTMSVDGILGRVTAKALRRFRGCNPRTGRSADLDDASEAKRLYDLVDSVPVIFCHMEPAVSERFDPVLGEGKTVALITDAWDAWIEHINLSVKTQGVKKEDANVVIQVGPVDGSSGVELADSDVAGPSFLKIRQCTVKIDEEEKFDESKFLWMMTHELGHILGMGHYAQQGMIMSEWLDQSVEGPTTADTDILQEIWK